MLLYIRRHAAVHQELLLYLITISLSVVKPRLRLQALATQGTFNCISGGMLLYISLIQLIAEDFSREDSSKPASGRVRLGSYAALFLGAASMCIIAIWA